MRNARHNAALSARKEGNASFAMTRRRHYRFRLSLSAVNKETGRAGITVYHGQRERSSTPVTHLIADISRLTREMGEGFYRYKTTEPVYYLISASAEILPARRARARERGVSISARRTLLLDVI